MRIIFTLLLILLTQLPLYAYTTIPLQSQSHSIEYSAYYNAIIIRNPITQAYDFISADDYAVIMSVTTGGVQFDIRDNVMVAYNQYWDEWASDIFLINCDTEESELIYTTETPLQAVKYVDENTLYYTRSISPLKDIISFTETHWYEYPYDSRLGIINPSTGQLIAEYPIQSYSENIILSSDGRIVTTSHSLINNDSREVTEGFVNIYDPVTETVCEGRVVNGMQSGCNCVVAVIDDEPVLVNTTHAFPLFLLEDPIVIYDIDTWDILDTYHIEVPGYITDFTGIKFCDITASGIFYTYLRPTGLSENYQSIPSDNHIIGWVNLNTRESGAIEFYYEDSLLDIAVKDGDPDKVFILTEKKEILVFEL